MRNIDTDHPDWKDLRKDDSPSWCPSMRQSRYEKASGNQIKGKGYYDWGTEEILPLYLDLDGVDREHPLKHCDLKHTVFDLVKYSNSANTNLEMADKLVVAYDSITRGGGVKFQKFSDWNFCYRTNVLDTK